MALGSVVGAVGASRGNPGGTTAAVTPHRHPGVVEPPKVACKGHRATPRVRLVGGRASRVLGCLRAADPFGGRRELALLLRWVLREAARLRTAGVAGSEATHGTNGSYLSVFSGMARTWVSGPMVALREAAAKRDRSVMAACRCSRWAAPTT